MVIFVCTWFMTIIIFTVITNIGKRYVGMHTHLLDLQPLTVFYIALYIGIGSVIVGSVNAYVYAARSTEYRAAFVKL